MLGDKVGSPGYHRRVRAHVFGHVKESLGNNEYTVEWDDPGLQDSKHFYHRNKLGHICGVKRTRNDRPVSRAHQTVAVRARRSGGGDDDSLVLSVIYTCLYVLRSKRGNHIKSRYLRPVFDKRGGHSVAKAHES